MNTNTPQPKVALVIGAGDSTGGAIAKRFAREGFIACVTRRSADKLQPLVDSIRSDGGQAFGYASDARKEEDVKALFEQIESAHGPVEVLVFNIGANVPCSILDETARKYFKIWEMATTFPERYALKDQDGILNPDHIAENYWHLHNQPRDAWTFELDLRPYMERW